MKNIKNFFKRPRNLYYSIIILLIVVTGLFSISFSYYIGESGHGKQLVKFKGINNIIQSDYLNSNEIILEPNSEKTININVISNNEFDTNFKLYYIGENVDVYSKEDISGLIGSKDVLNYDLVFKNNSLNKEKVVLGIVNGYVGNNIEIPGIEIVKK